MEANRRVAEALFRRDMVGPTFGHVAASVTSLLLVEKVFLDLCLPRFVPMLEVIFAAMGRLPATMTLGMGVSGLGFWGAGTIFAIPAIMGSSTWKIQEKRCLDLNMLRQAMPLIVFNFFLGTLVAPLMFYAFLPENAYDLRTRPGTCELVWHCIVWVAVEEIMFFYLHRWMHVNKSMYKAIHKIHHTWTAPVSFSAIYCHPFEHIVVNVIPLVVGPIICGSHVLAIGVYLFAGLVHTTGAHSGYWICDDNGMHDEHHRKFDVNYGAIGIMDSLYGTYCLPPGAAGAPSAQEPTKHED